VGADKCSTKGCDLSAGVVADDAANTLTIHLTAPDPEFLDKLALPFAYVVPASTSPKLTGNNVPPGTGPYKWLSYNPNSEAVLVRNKYFHVWNAQAQPAGYPDKIVEKYGQTISDEVTAVQNGQADEVFDGVIPPDRLSELNGPQYRRCTCGRADGGLVLGAQHRAAGFSNLKARPASAAPQPRRMHQDRRGGPGHYDLQIPAQLPGYSHACCNRGRGPSKWTELAQPGPGRWSGVSTAGMRVVAPHD
jgi:peptide/nickel transport system substrate-binding protein